MEINKKREAELFKLKQELDDANLHHETGLASIRQKHNAIIADLGDQIDQLNKGEKFSPILTENATFEKVPTLTSINNLNIAVMQWMRKMYLVEKGSYM